MWRRIRTSPGVFVLDHAGRVRHPPRQEVRGTCARGPPDRRSRRGTRPPAGREGCKPERRDEDAAPIAVRPSAGGRRRVAARVRSAPPRSFGVAGRWRWRAGLQPRIVPERWNAPCRRLRATSFARVERAAARRGAGPEALPGAVGLSPRDDGCAVRPPWASAPRACSRRAHRLSAACARRSLASREGALARAKRDGGEDQVPSGVLGLRSGCRSRWTARARTSPSGGRSLATRGRPQGGESVLPSPGAATRPGVSGLEERPSDGGRRLRPDRRQAFTR